MTRPSRLVVVTGTGTEIGKTWVAAGLLAALAARGWRVAARKPAQSGHPGEVTDADRLGAATGEDPAAVCPPHRSYGVSMAPPMAAEALGLPPFTIAELAAEVTASWPSPAVELGVVEGAGGVAAPQAADGDTAGLIAALHPDVVVLVADAGLGVINLVRLSLLALGERPVVHLNRWTGDELQRRNRAWLSERDGDQVTTSIPELAEHVPPRPRR